MTDDEKIKFLESHVSKLEEHFDVVQIMCSGVDDKGETYSTFAGGGNWYARQGMAHDFVHRDQAGTYARKLAEALDPPDDQDTWKTKA